MSPVVLTPPLQVQTLLRSNVTHHLSPGGWWDFFSDYGEVSFLREPVWLYAAHNNTTKDINAEDAFGPVLSVQRFIKQSG